jgi:ADP-ribose pyrophosphatase
LTEGWPRIKSRHITKLSPWVEIVAREVEFVPGEPAHLYHAVAQHDYVCIVAVTPDKLIPVVRQYRPAVEKFTWELPAGLVDPGEDPAESGRRELQEETGYSTRALHPLGASYPCTGRMSNRLHSFFIEAGDRAGTFQPEPGLTVKLVSPAELGRLIAAEEFNAQHLGTLLLATLHEFIALEL